MSREAHREAGLPPEGVKGKPMRNFLTARWRGYAVAFVAAAASLGIVGACSSLKPPPPKPSCAGAGENRTSFLTFQPTLQNFTAGGQTFSFTVTNVGPGGVFFGNTYTEGEFVGRLTGS